MQNLLVFYGGKSVEHDISILTAIQTMKNINKQKYNIIPIYLTKKLKFISPKNYLDIKTYINEKMPYKKVDFLYGERKVKIGLKKYDIYCAINCFHGATGEDGTLFALMNLCDIPITSCSILASSICMDKVIMKDIFRANDIPCVDYTLVTYDEYFLDQEETIKNVEERLTYPVIVKPSNLGSSIGIDKANNSKELERALDIAFSYDRRVIIEKCLENFKEINISCLGNNFCELSCLEQPQNWKDFLNFQDKYTKKDVISKKIINPKLTNEIQNKIQTLAKQCFRVFDLSGVVRIDFMVKNNNVYVNEINTVPGSLAFYLWKGKNVEFFELIERLIDLAIKKHKQHCLCQFDFNSNVLLNYSKTSAKIHK